MTRQPATRTSTRTVLRRGAVAAAAAAALLLAVPAATGTSLGAWASELTGHRDTARYDSPADAPAGVLPSWLPEGTSDVVVVRPGPRGGVERSLRRVEAAVPAGWAPPQGCTLDAGYSQPWDGGGDWPLSPRSAISTCPDRGAAWKVVTGEGRVYAWR